MLIPMSFWRSVSRVVPLALAIALVSAPSARAAADENGWFEPGPTPLPAPDSAAAAAPTGAELPSLAPSPLLSEREHSSPPVQSASVEANSETDPRALTAFRPTLDPYGSWMQHPTYGTVWVPSREVVGSGFAPYVSSGRWALDDGGQWVWVSDYPFGSVVFHYGRWVWVTGNGWAWVPGYRYAPAWVSWRVPTGSYAYVGWAPLGPDYVWHNGVAVSFWYGVPTPWVFCPSVYVFHRHVHHYVVRDRALVTRVAANTRRYSPAVPRAGARAERASYVSGPPLASARVPAHAVPRERVRQVSPERAATFRSRADFGDGLSSQDRRIRSVGTPRGTLRPDAARPLLPARPSTEARPSERLPVRTLESRDRTRVAPTPAPVRRTAPEPVRRAEPARPAEAPRRVAPPVRRAEPAPRLAPMQRPAPIRRMEPVRPMPRGPANFQRQSLPRSRR